MKLKASSTGRVGVGSKYIFIAAVFAILISGAFFVSVDDDNRLSDTSDGAPWQGDGLQTSPFIITTADHLNTNFRNYVSANSGASGVYFELGNDITLSGSWVPLPDFKGNFNGNGYTISNLSVTGSYAKSGLFVSLTNSYVCNFYITVASGGVSSSAANADVAALAASASGTISNVHVILNGSIQAKGQGLAGGFVALSDATILGSSVSGTGSVNGGANGYENAIPNLEIVFHAGGFVGTMRSGTIISCYASINVINSGVSRTGGFVGNMVAGSISYSYATGNVTANSTISAVVSQSLMAGGFAGNAHNISSCYATGNISASANLADAGGFAGQIDATGKVSDSYARGNVSLTVRSSNSDPSVGGFVGYQNGTTEHCYSTGKPTLTGNGTVGGYVGIADNTNTDTFFDQGTSGTTKKYGETYSPNYVNKIYATTTSDMKKIGTFTAKGWSTSKWSIDGTTNDGYPILLPSNVTVHADINPAGGGSVSYRIQDLGPFTAGSDVTVPYGTSVTFMATPTDTWGFDNWTGGVTSDRRQITLTPLNNVNLTANFFSGVHTLELHAYPADAGSFTYTLNGAGPVTYIGPVDLRSTDKVTVTAVSKTGYTFSAWSGNYGTSQTTTLFTMSTDKSITAVFKSTDTGKNTIFTLNADPSVGGSFEYKFRYEGTSDYTDTFYLTSGSSVTLLRGIEVQVEAKPSANYMFDRWTDDLSTSSIRNVILPSVASYSLTAKFVQSIVISAVSSPSGAGTFEFSEDGSTFVTAPGDLFYSIPGSTVYIKAIPTGSNSFRSWNNDVLTPILTVAPTVNTTYTASFLSTAVDVSATTPDASRGTFQFSLDNTTFYTVPDDTVHVAPGTSVYVKAIAEPSYTFGYWAGAYGTDPVATVIAPSAGSTTVTAYFAGGANVRTLDVNTTGGNGTGRVSVTVGTNSPAILSSGTLHLDGGAVAGVEAIETAGALFQYWSGALSTAESAGNITLDDDKTITANFGTTASSSLLTINFDGTGTVGYTYDTISGATPVTVSGSVTANASIRVPNGTDVLLTEHHISPNVFLYWSVGSDGHTGASYAATVTGPTAVTAHFGNNSAIIDYHTLNVGKTGNGTVAWNYTDGTVTVTGSTGAFSVHTGTTVYFTATPEGASDVFVNWSGDLKTAVPEGTVTVDAPSSVIANFGTTSAASALTI
ncbi:MAG: hypothetical protein LBM39_03440, partial [Candidatus Methanoplasma sp.]|nr:hypothetical protein [Candidatus Methanoplasma sp.]